MPRSLWKSALKYRRVTDRDFGFDCFEWDSVSDTAREFVMSCLAYKPIHRLTAANCLKHPWLQQVENVRPAPLRIKSKLRDFAKGMKLPLKTYAAGDVLIHQGARATDEVFLIKSGRVQIVVSPTDADGNILRDQGSKVATREPGEFIGEMALGDRLIAKTSAPRLPLDQRIAEALAKGPPKRRRSDKLTLKSWVSARIVAKKWIGGRRNADVVAESNVQCLVMGRREMAWAIASDPDVGAELRKSMHQRRQELVSASQKE
jgi:CRP-like cAMP-binding protein